MTKLFLKLNCLFFAGIISLFGLLFPLDIKANDSLEVTFSSEPLFSETNFLPGDSATSSISIKNNFGEEKSIYFWTRNVADPDNFGEALNLEIKEGANTLYNNLLSHLFQQTSVFLSNVPAGSQTQYDLTLTFDPTAGNEYQGKSLQMDIFIGSVPPSEEEESGGGGGGGGTSLSVSAGGGSPLPQNLTIFNVLVKNIKETKATITWQTNLFSTSQIVYSTQAESHEFAPENLSLYGYAHLFPALEDSKKVTFHTVLLSGLSPCTTYYFRAVSHNSSTAISKEHSFATVCPEKGGEKEKEEKGEQGKPSPAQPPEGGKESGGEKEKGGPLAQGPSGKIKGLRETKQVTIGEKPQEKEKKPAPQQPEEKKPGKPSQPGFWENFLADIGSLFKGSSCLPWWLLLILALWPLTMGLLTSWQIKKAPSAGLSSFYKRAAISWGVWFFYLLVLPLIFYLLKETCLNIWVFIILIFASALVWWFIHRCGKLFKPGLALL